MCGCFVEAAASNCWACGVPFHTAEPTVDARISDPAAQQRPKPDRNIGAGIFAVLLIVGFWTLHTVLKYHSIPAVRQKHLELPLYCVYVAAFLLILWAGKYLDIL